MQKLLRRFINDERGLELSEYAVMVGLIVVIVILIITTIGNQIAAIFQHLSDALVGPAAG